MSTYTLQQLVAAFPEAATELTTLLQRVKHLEGMLFPYAQATEISGMSWSGFYVLGDKKSIKKVQTAVHYSEQIDEYREAFKQREQALLQRCEKAEKERDEAVDWSDIVDRHGTDQFDNLADAWIATTAIQRVTNAATSTFAKWASEDLMDRFCKQQLAMFHMAFVEGCLAGVKAAEARAETAEAGPQLELKDGTYVPLASLIHAQHQVKELIRERDEALESCARIAERDTDWVDRDDARLKSWNHNRYPLQLPAEGIPWDQIDRWAYVVGIVTGSNIAKEIRAARNAINGEGHE